MRYQIALQTRAEYHVRFGFFDVDKLGSYLNDTLLSLVIYRFVS